MTKKPTIPKTLVLLHNFEAKAIAAAKAEGKTLAHWVSCLIARAVKVPDPVQKRGLASLGPRRRKQIAKMGRKTQLDEKREATK